MNATSEFHFNAPTGYSGTDYTAAPARKPGLLAQFRTWLAEQPRRRAVLAELRSLTDHELADIGLARTDLHRVFDPEFVGTFRS